MEYEVAGQVPQHDNDRRANVDLSPVSGAEQSLHELARMPIDTLLARANPQLRSILLRHFGEDTDAGQSNGRFGSFISPEL